VRLAWLTLLLWMAPGLAADHAVALLYHHVDAHTPPSTSVTPKIFAAHLDYLAENGFTVLPLGRVLATLRRGEALPPNTVSITFDDAYKSVFTEAYPLLKAHGWSATLFVSSEAVDRKFGEFMNWEQVRRLVADGFEIGNHSDSHAHLVRRVDGEDEAAWRRRVEADIERAQQRIGVETGSEPRLFAYPYGEYSPALEQVVDGLGFIGIAQRSGAIGTGSDFLALPRFPMSTGYADMQRFATAVNARPLPVVTARATGEHAVDGRLDGLRLEIAPGAYRASQLACYSSSGERLPLKISGGQPLRLSITLQADQAPGRNKVNCTAPATDKSGAWLWYSYLWLVKNPDGSWYRE